MNLDGIHFGQLDVRIKIEEPTISKNSVTSEDTTSAWTEVKKVWAKRMSKSDERIEANQGVAFTGSTYLIRHTEGIDETMRVNDYNAGEYHYIKGIERVDRKQFMILRTEKRDNE